MALTKKDLQEALKQQKKEITLEIGEFLEKYVMEPIFGLKKDVSGLKKDVSMIKKDVSILKKDMGEVKHEVGQINRRIDSVYDRGDRQTDQLQNHEKRVSKLESTSIISA